MMYDGKRFTHFKYSSQLEACDPDSHIYKLLCDDDGQIWAAHISGLSVFDGSNLSFDSFPSPEGSLTNLIQLGHGKYRQATLDI